MGRARHCSICTSDPAICGQVNALIESGVRQRMIHDQFSQFSISQISRHSRGCLQPKLTSDLSTEQGSAEIARWLERAESTFLVAQANGDTKSAASAISTAVRTLQSLHKKQEAEKKAEKDGVDRDSVAVTVKGIDALLNEYAKQPEDFRAVDARAVQLLGDQQFRQLVNAIWNNRDLLPALLTASADYIPERTTEHVNASAND
jgi:hypothetical protein